ncbi:transmembrane protein, putative [Bodo saltans]|uniref:Transmembrane protein, putative n=1 Tax=Bodo saltans TaxID=75058 RepID=A0A0S4JWW3_BODSA|nr:transmembrane protein, putative [Bodo saltans]|eukprot:CUG93634.1 transmembrane protein, putative [Bodo saltans]
MNTTTRLWQEASSTFRSAGAAASSNNATSRLVLARSDDTTKYLVHMDPMDGSVTSWFPASEPALRQRFVILGNGLYVEVRQRTDIESSNVTTTTSSSMATGGGGGVRSPSMWRDVFLKTMIPVNRLSTSSASSTTATLEAAVQPTTIAVYHVPERMFTACAEVTTVTTTDASFTPNVLQLSAVVPVGSTPALSSSVSAQLSQSPGCSSVFSFLRTTDVGTPSLVDAVSQASDSNYIVWTSLGSTSTWALLSNTTASLSSDVISQRLGLSPAQRASDDFVVVVVVPQGVTEANIIRTKGEIGVVAFVVAAVTVTLLVATMRMISQPLPALTKAIDACATLQLHKIEIMEASMITEIADIQRALNYLSIRLHHYLKYLPDRRVIEYVTALNSSDEEDEDTSSNDSDEESNDDEGDAADGGGKDAVKPSLEAQQLATPLLQKKHSSVRLSKRGEDEDAQEMALEEKLLDQRRFKHPKTPMHSVLVNVIYESRHLNRNTMDRWKIANKSAEFVFKHRVSDPVLNMLTRQCREQLNERPGEILLLYSGKKDGSDFGMRQLFTDEDVLFALEQCKAANSISQLGASFSSSNGAKGGSIVGGGSSTTSNDQLPVLHLCIRKGSVKSVLPLLIALSTFFSVISRFVLAVQRLSADATEQLLGLTLLGCFGVQVAQNALISLYLVRRFRILDRDFKAWAEVSPREVLVGVIFGSLNVTNLEVIGCHVRLSQGLRLSAPISARLRMKISMYSFVGFIVGDLLPFVFILIYTILTGQYRDPYALISVIFSVVSVVSILVSHGIMRFVLVGRTNTGSGAGGSGGGGGAGQGSSGSSSPSLGRSLLLSRREITILHLRITAAESLIDKLSISLADKLLEQLYETVQKNAKKSGGLLIEAQGLSLVIAWNSHNVVPNHSLVAYRAFLKIREEVEKSVLSPFFSSDKMRAYVGKLLPSSHRAQPTHVTNAVRALHHKHRVVGSILTGDMAMGYVGTLTSQSFQRVGAYGVVCDGLSRLNELYGSTLLSTKATLDAIQASAARGGHRGGGGGGPALLLTRKLDEVVLSTELSVTESHLTMLSPYVVAADASSTATNKATTNHKSNMEAMLKRAQQALPSVAPTGDTIPVYELIVHSFVNPATADLTSPLNHLPTAASTPQAHGMGAPPGPSNTTDLLPIYQMRLRARGGRVTDAVHQFLDAMDVLRSFQNTTPMERYLELQPDDVVASRVFRWARFLEAPNRDIAIRYPRVLSSLGISRHYCETPDGSHLTPQHDVTDTERIMSEVQKRMEERNLRLRPPRSVRRAKEFANRAAAGGDSVSGGLGLAGTSGEVVEQVLGAQGGYTIRFHQGGAVSLPAAVPTSAANVNTIGPDGMPPLSPKAAAHSPGLIDKRSPHLLL